MIRRAECPRRRLHVRGPANIYSLDVLVVPRSPPMKATSAHSHRQVRRRRQHVRACSRHALSRHAVPARPVTAFIARPIRHRRRPLRHVCKFPRRASVPLPIIAVLVTAIQHNSAAHRRPPQHQHLMAGARPVRTTGTGGCVCRITRSGWVIQTVIANIRPL